MASQKEKLKCIKQVLDNELKGSRLKLVKGIYRRFFIDEEEWNRNKYFVFQNVETETEFSIRSSNLTDVCFHFRKDLIYIASSYGRASLFANNDMIIYRIGERKIFVYLFAKKETIRIDDLTKEEIFKITRNSKSVAVNKPTKKSK